MKVITKDSSGFEKKKVLFILQGIGIGGVSSVILNYYRRMRQCISADFITIQKKGTIPEEVVRELTNDGCHIFYVTPFQKNMLKYSFEIMSILNSNDYDIVHDNDKYFAFLSLIPARMKHIRKRICHVHNCIAKDEKKWYHRMFINISQQLSICAATDLLACSHEAGKSMFGDSEFEIINNAIDPDMYKFDSKYRENLRKKYGFDNKFVVVFVARNDTLKRFDFAFKVFNRLKNKKSDAVLCIIGFNREDMFPRDRAAYDQLSDAVKSSIVFMGKRHDVHKLLNMADASLLTSIHEGFGIIVVEAQANGLPCFVSDAIPHSVAVTKLVKFLPTVAQEELWADNICGVSHLGVSERIEYHRMLKNSDFSVVQCVDKLKRIYCIE